MDTLQRKFYEALGVTEALFDKKKLVPLTVQQAQRILSITHIDDLTDDDYELIDKNTNAAMAYYKHLENVSGLENSKPDSLVADVIELFPAQRLISPTVPDALAASSSNEDDQFDQPPTRVQTRYQEVTLKFEIRTNPMTRAVTTRIRLFIEKPSSEAIVIAWVLKGDDRAIMQCEIPPGATESVSTRIFTKEQWDILKGMAFEFGEINQN